MALTVQCSEVTIKSYFRPGSEDFDSFECTWPENGPAVSVMAGDSVAVMGWIPHYLRQEELPEGFLREEWPRSVSIAALLSTGNQRPPKVIEDGQRGFIRHLDNLDFRGALSLARPTLFVGLQGKPVLVRFSSLARPGFTTIRPSHFYSPLKRVQMFDGGFGSTEGVVYHTADLVTVRVFLRTKLGFVGQVFAVLHTGKWPPWATLMIGRGLPGSGGRMY